MKLGNPIQAAILSVVAIAALVFLVLRLIPPGPAAATSVSSPVHGGPAAARPSDLPTEVGRDAFSHPAITKKFLAALPATPPKTIDASELPYSPLLDGTRPAPIAHEFKVAEAEAKPGEKAGIDRQQEDRPKSKIALRAIMRATTPLAIVAIDGGPDETVGLGEYIDRTCQITKFSADGVLLRFQDGKTWLTVGQEVTEK